MWVYRRLLRISWRDRVRNEDVLARLHTDRTLLTAIKTRKLEYFAHVMRNKKYHLLHLIIQGKIEGRRSAGRRRTSWLANLRKWYQFNTHTLFRVAASKVKTVMMIANLQP